MRVVVPMTMIKGRGDDMRVVVSMKVKKKIRDNAMRLGMCDLSGI